MAKVVVDIKGIEDNLARVQARIQAAARKALNEIGEDIKAKTIPRAPIDTEKLRLSFYVKHGGTDKIPIVEIGSMGAVDRSNGFYYAIIQHETQEFEHPNGGEWKYLEKTVNEAKPNFVNNMAEQIEKNFTI